MSAVIGGWVAGYAMSIVCTFAFTWMLMKSTGPNLIERALGAGTSVGIAAIPLSLGFMYGWTILGLIAGIVYDLTALGDAPDFLGSPSWPFLFGSALIALLPLPFAILTWPRHWRMHLLLSASFLGIFGWGMPIMAAQ